VLQHLVEVPPVRQLRLQRRHVRLGFIRVRKCCLGALHPLLLGVQLLLEDLRVADVLLQPLRLAHEML
jgi:hypothetical protein